MEKPNLILYGRVIALSPVQEIASREAGKSPMRKRELYIDCTRYDSITGQRDERENKPLLEFGGDKVLDKIAGLDLQKGDVVCVKFSIQGNPYKDDKTGKTKVFTAVRCYDLDLIRREGQKASTDAQVNTPTPPPAPQEPAPMAQSPFVGEDQAQGQQKDPNLPF